ncbi:MAG TPA: serine hydrolase domain-containing protein [bacterium]|nr:serine hydrolase domain-containing protein [bacterium]
MATCLTGTDSSQAGDHPVTFPDSVAAPQGSVIQYKSLDAYLNAMTPPLLSPVPGKVGIAIGTILNQRLGKFYYGETALDGGKAPDGGTLFLIASISKTFTATLLALDVEQHLVNLDDPIQKYLPAGVTAPLFNNDASHPITLAHLATHTSGLPLMPTFPSYAGPASSQKLFGSLNQAQLASVPGAKYVYSNYGYALLGQILARVGNQDWRDLNESAVANALLMADTKVASQLSAEETSRRAPGNNAVAGEWTFFPAENPAGGLYSSLDDMSRYLNYAMGLSGSPLESLLPSLFQPRHGAGSSGEIGLGWNIGTLSGTGEQVIWKDGGLLGYESFIGFVPSKGVGVVMLVNSQGINLNGFAQQTLAFLLTNPTQSQDPIPLPQVDPATLPPGPGPGPVEQVPQAAY